MTGRPVVSGIGAVFNDAIVERIKQRAVRDAAASKACGPCRKRMFNCRLCRHLRTGEVHDGE